MINHIKIIPIISLALIISGCTSVPSSSINSNALKKINRIAVLPFSDAPGADAGWSGHVISGMVQTEAMKRNDWTVIERAQIDKVIKEQNLQHSGYIDQRTAVKLGRILGANGIIMGAVSQYEIGSIPFFFLLVFDKNIYRMGCNFRLINVETGELCWSTSATSDSWISMEKSSYDAISEAFLKLNEQFPASSNMGHKVLEDIPEVEKVVESKNHIARTPPPSSQKGKSPNSKHFAIIIGISSYKDSRIPSLRYAANDAQSFYRWLVSRQGGRYAPDDVKLLLNDKATGVNIKNALFKWGKRAIKEDMITIFFAGHGSPDVPGESSDNLYLLPYDTDYENIAATGFPMWDMETALKRFIKAGKVVIIADACHSGGVGQSFEIARRSSRGFKANPVSNGLHKLSELSDGVCVISASNSNQLSQEDYKWGNGHGVFTHYILQGLNGKADYNKDHVVNIGELTSYVSEKVRRETNDKQTPTVSGRYDPALSIGK